MRNVDLCQLDNPERLRKLFTEQLVDEVSSQHNFDFGYYQGNARVSVRSVEDCKELAKNAVKSKSILWCMGVDKSSKRARALDDLDSDEGSDNETRRKSKRGKKRSKHEEKMDRIDDTIDELKELHSTNFNSIQYRVWAETILAGTHTSLESLPKGSFFKKKKKNSTPRKSVQMTEPKDLTPSKSASLRSTYIQQIRDCTI